MKYKRLTKRSEDGYAKYGWDYDEKTGKISCTRELKKPFQSWGYVEGK